MSSWVYGFIELHKTFDEESYNSVKELGVGVDKEGFYFSELVLCEIYFKDKKPFMFNPVDLKEVREDWKLILKDLKGQFKAGKFWKESDFK